MDEFFTDLMVERQLQTPEGERLGKNDPPLSKSIHASSCCSARRHVMLIGLRIGVLALGLMATTAAAQSPHRLVVVVGWPTDPRVAQQHVALENDAAALRERDVVVQDITPEAARRERPDLGVPPEAVFEMLLVGKDGGVKLRRTNPVTASEIIALIDTMPMRQSEMRRQKGAAHFVITRAQEIPSR